MTEHPSERSEYERLLAEHVPSGDPVLDQMWKQMLRVKIMEAELSEILSKHVSPGVYTDPHA